MTFTLPKKTRLLWQVRIILAFALVCAAVAFFSRYTLWFLLPTAIIATLGLLACFIYIPFYFKSYKISVDENSIVITKGIILKTINVMPYPRLVFARCFTTPLSTFLNLKCIVLKAARGWILIPEIEIDKADVILDSLRVMRND